MCKTISSSGLSHALFPIDEYYEITFSIDGLFIREWFSNIFF